MPGLRIKDHLIRPANLSLSAHCEERPAGEISLLVLHSISLPEGDYTSNSVCELFTGKLDCHAHPSFAELAGLHVSAHLFIRRAGELWQFVPFDKAAWHAGESSFDGREGCNAFSIGIELEGSKDDIYTDAQYAALTGVCQALLATYPDITPKRIVGHQDIAPSRKDDPWNLDWPRLRQSLNP